MNHRPVNYNNWVNRGVCAAVSFYLDDKGHYYRAHVPGLDVCIPQGKRGTVLCVHQATDAYAQSVRTDVDVQFPLVGIARRVPLMALTLVD